MFMGHARRDRHSATRGWSVGRWNNVVGALANLRWAARWRRCTLRAAAQPFVALARAKERRQSPAFLVDRKSLSSREPSQRLDRQVSISRQVPGRRYEAVDEDRRRHVPVLRDDGGPQTA